MSVLPQVSAVGRCPLMEVPLYTYYIYIAELVHLPLVTYLPLSSNNNITQYGSTGYIIRMALVVQH